MRHSIIVMILSFALSLGVNAEPNLVFIGTGDNGPSPGELFEIDLATNGTTSISTLSIGGMTADSENGVIYFTAWQGTSGVGFANLYMFPVGGTPTQIGVLNLGGSEDFRIDGLAMVNGQLYGSRAAFDRDGLYLIDMTTFGVTLLDPLAGRSVSGIDGDPVSGLIYGSDDASGMVISIDPGTLAIASVTAYPAGASDIDGVGMDDQGNIYLMEDEPSPIQIYNLGSSTFSTLATPITASTVFSAGAAVFCTGPVPTVPTMGEGGLISLGMLLMILGVVAVGQRKTAIA